MFERALSIKLRELFEKYPMVAVTGPRQSGKTTMVKDVFPQARYVSLEDPDIRDFALNDPRGFLATYPAPCIIDEVQRVPSLFSYLQTRVDEADQEGQFVLTGSFNLGLLEGISQSLAGRVALLNLLPLSFAELTQHQNSTATLHDLLISGFYPRIHAKGLNPQEWYANYVNTYLERDVRMVTRVMDLARFQLFLKMCAARSGQLLNLSSLSEDCGITHNTARSWISVLQASFIIFLLQPHHRNFNKRLVKTPKLYFYDTGLLCYLLAVNDPHALAISPSRGPIFETWVIGELMKGRYNRGLRENLFFWRDNVGHEVDCLVDHGTRLLPIEIKSGETVTADFFKGLRYWHDLAGEASEDGYLVYGGTSNQRRKSIHVVGWQHFSRTVPSSI
jgi:hypothetical protein